MPSGTFTAGQSIDVGFRDPSRANGTVTITVENGDSINPEKIEIEIKLDASGHGEVSFQVPDWWSMQFNGGGAKQVTRFIDEK